MRIDIKEIDDIKQGQIRRNSRGNKLALVVDGFQHNGTKYVRYLRIEKQQAGKHDSMAMGIAELEAFMGTFISAYSGAIQIQATPAAELVDIDYPEYEQLRNIMYRGGYYNEKK